ncbi:MAG: hypothetical protein EPN85_10485 [Bacteroidetes bacterium]|nr:MAG: hypothetical protein EPN85_10485 [Bacteroidota bacterium]
MHTTTDLFELIQSLTPQEKKYFRRYTALHVRGEKNKYMLLFEAIAKQTRQSSKKRNGGGQEYYDEEKLKKQFRHEKFMNQFAVAKNYLCSQILKSLRSYHHSTHSEVKDLIRNAEILFEKGLSKQSQKYIKKAKKIAREHEMHHALMEIFHYWELKLALKNIDVSWIQNILREEAEEISLLKNKNFYSNNYFRLVVHYQLYGPVRNKKHFGQIKKMMHSRFLTDIAMAKTFQAKLYFHDAHVVYFRIIDDRRGLYHSSKNIITLFKKHPERIRRSVSVFVAYLNNVLDACTQNKKYNEMPFYLNELESLAPLAKSSHEKAKIFYYAAINRLNYYNITGQFSNAVSPILEIKKQFDEYKQFMGDFEKAFLFQNIAMFYFGARQYKNCIHWLNRIRNEISLNISHDLESFLRLFYIIVHYEAGNMDLLIPLIQSLYRYLKKKEQLYKFETIIIIFFRNEFPKTNTQQERAHTFQKLKNKLLLLTKDEYEKNAFEYFDYISWLESKIENRPFAEVVRQKAISV